MNRHDGASARTGLGAPNKTPPLTKGGLGGSGIPPEHGSGSSPPSPPLVRGGGSGSRSYRISSSRTGLRNRRRAASNSANVAGGSKSAGSPSREVSTMPTPKSSRTVAVHDRHPRRIAAQAR